MAHKPAATPSIARRELDEKISALAWKDDDFRRKFLADPRKQFEERLGIKLPASLKMSAHAEDESSLHFVIPARPKANLGELSDADLEKVAGGCDVGTTVVVATIIASAVAGVASLAGTIIGGYNGWDKK